MPQTKTAKDLPPGAVVETFWTTWTKARPDKWTNGLNDTMTDTEVDGLLASGDMLTRVPTSTCTKEADRG